LGYMSMDMGQMEKSKMFFDYLIKYYPNSSNANESMADYFERQEDYLSAIEFVTKAYELSGEEYYQERKDKLKEKVGMNDNKD
jgi:tetratricopeptide (TPR) repeat protein